MGRRTTFTPEIKNELIKCAENGMTQQDAAAFVQMPPSTLSKWLKRGKEAKSGKMHNFYLRWQEATVKFKYYYFNLIKDAAKKGDVNSAKYIYEDCLRKAETNNDESENGNELVNDFFKRLDWSVHAKNEANKIKGEDG